MLRDYRSFLESELKLLGNASHHAYSLGQANMAKRALDAFDAELAATLYLPLAAADARSALTALSMLQQQSTARVPELDALHDALAAALAQAEAG